MKNEFKSYDEFNKWFSDMEKNGLTLVSQVKIIVENIEYDCALDVFESFEEIGMYGDYEDFEDVE